MPLKPEIAGGGLNEYQVIQPDAGKLGGAFPRERQCARRLIQTLWSKV